MAHLQLSQKSFITCLRKLTIIAPFILRNNLLVYFFLNKKKRDFFFFNFQNCPKKGAKGDAVYIVKALKVFLTRMKQKRPLKKIKLKKLKKIKIGQNCLFQNFPKLPPKRCPGGCRLHPQRPQSVFEEDEVEEAAESSSSKCLPGYTYFVQLN